MSIAYPTTITAESITTAMLQNEAVTAPKIGASAVVNTKIKNLNVEQEKVKQDTIPATGGAEGQFGLGGGGVGRTLVANLNAKAEAGPYTLNHKQNSESPILIAYNKTKKTSVGITWEVINSEEVKFTLSVPPAAKDEVLINVFT